MVEWYIVARHNYTPQKNKEVHRRQQFRNAGACFIKNTVLGIRLSNKTSGSGKITGALAWQIVTQRSSAKYSC